MSFALSGAVVLAPCGPNGCMATVSLSNTVTSTSPYVTVNQPVNAQVTINMTLDGRPVQTCSVVVSMPPNGSTSTQCSASYYVAPSRTPRTYVVRAEAIAVARAVIQTDIDAMIADLRDEQLSLELLGPNARPQVPGTRIHPQTGRELRGLPAHEGPRAPVGLGHTMTKHVGWSDQQLLGRMQNNPPPDAVSTYPNLAVADRTVGRAIADNEEAIQSWLGDPNGSERFELLYRSESVTGRHVGGGSTTVSDVYGAYVLLLRSERGQGAELGYYIVTSYPVP